jgi:iron(III) transport system permease protein
LADKSTPPPPLARALAALAIAGASAVVLSPLAASLMGASRASLATFEGLAGSATSAAVTALVSLGLGVPFALVVERSGTSFRRLGWALAIAVLMVPPYLAAEGAVVLLGPAGKLSRPVATWLGAGPRSADPAAMARFTLPDWIDTPLALGVVMGGCLFPVVSLAVASAWRRTDGRAFESARLAQGRRGVVSIAVRVLGLPALGASILVFGLTLTEFGAPQLLRVRTVSEAVYEQIQQGDLASAAAISLVLLPVVVGAGALVGRILMRRRVASLAGLEGEVPRWSAAAEPRPLMSRLAAAPVLLVAILPGLIVPAVSLVWLASASRIVSRGPQGSSHTSGFLDALQRAWALAHGDAIRTVVLAAITASVATILAVALVRMVSRVGWGPWLGILGAGVAVPAPVVGLGLIALWNRPGYEAIAQGPAIVVLAWLARFFPVAVFLAQGSLARVPRELEEAASLAGCGAMERLARVVLPGAWPGLVASWVAVDVLSATELGATALVAPPGQPLLAPTVVTLMRRGQDPEIAAYQLLLLAVVAWPLVVVGLGTLFGRGRS